MFNDDRIEQLLDACDDADAGYLGDVPFIVAWAREAVAALRPDVYQAASDDAR